MVSICGKQFLAHELHPLSFTNAENWREKQWTTKEATGGSQEAPEIQEQLDSNRGGEPNRNLGMKSASEGDAGKNTTVPDHKQRDNWEGKRGWCQSMFSWCCERCQLQHKGRPATDGGVQTDMMGSKWQSHLSSLLLAPVDTDLQLGVCLWCKGTSSQVGMGSWASTQVGNRDAVSKSWWLHTDVDKIFTNVQAILLLCLYRIHLSFTSNSSLPSSWFQLQWVLALEEVIFYQIICLTLKAKLFCQLSHIMHTKIKGIAHEVL